MFSGDYECERILGVRSPLLAYEAEQFREEDVYRCLSLATGEEWLGAVVTVRTLLDGTWHYEESSAQLDKYGNAWTRLSKRAWDALIQEGGEFRGTLESSSGRWSFELTLSKETASAMKRGVSTMAIALDPDWQRLSKP
jgi:hypothetical protein